MTSLPNPTKFVPTRPLIDELFDPALGKEFYKVISPCSPVHTDCCLSSGLYHRDRYWRVERSNRQWSLPSGHWFGQHFISSSPFNEHGTRSSNENETDVRTLCCSTTTTPSYPTIRSSSFVFVISPSICTDISVALDQSFEKCGNQLSNLVRTESSKTIADTCFRLFHRWRSCLSS